MLDIDEILPNIESHAKQIVDAIGREAVDVYGFLCDEFARQPVERNCVFQFVYRSFYRLDNAGLTDDFKKRYFELMEMERSRNSPEVDLNNLKKLVEDLRRIPNRKEQESLQFSFVTKLANTVNTEYPIYDAQVANAFNFHPPYNKDFEIRLDRYMSFYKSLCDTYDTILRQLLLRESRRIFRETYLGPTERIPETKVLDFVFWSYGKLKPSFKTDQA